MARSKLSGPQFIISLFGGAIILLLLYEEIRDPSILGLGFLLLIAYWTVRLLYVMADPIDQEILQTPRTANSIHRDICPLCNTEPLSPYTLKVGYRRGRYSDFKYFVIWIQWSHSYEEIYSQIPICDHCRTRYLKACTRRLLPKGMRNPSKAILRRKLGYRRGIVFPFETWNVKSALDE